MGDWSWELTGTDCDAYGSMLLPPKPSKGCGGSILLSRNFPWSHHLCHLIHRTTCPVCQNQGDQGQQPAGAKDIHTIVTSWRFKFTAHCSGVSP